MEPLPPSVGAKPATSPRAPASSRQAPILSDLRAVSAGGLPVFGEDGVFIQLRTVARTADGRWLLETEGVRFTASGGPDLKPGLQLTARFRAGPPAILVLQTDKTVPLPSYSAQVPSPAPSPGQARFAQLRGLGLPTDALSLSLIDSFKAFSMKLDPAALAGTRAAVLRSSRRRSGRAESGRGEADRALTAVAAYDKGVELSDDALIAVAKDLDPDGRDHDSASSDERPSGAKLKALFEAQLKSGTALSWLNRLPGSSGKRWLAFPINLGNGSTERSETTAVVRLLVEEHAGVETRVDRLAMDIAGPTRLWRFQVDRPLADAELRLAAVPALGERADELEAELGVFMRSALPFKDWKIIVSKAAASDDPPEISGLSAAAVDETA